MKIYVIRGTDEFSETSWVHRTAYVDRLYAEKEKYSLDQASMDEETGSRYYHYIVAVEVE